MDPHDESPANPSLSESTVVRALSTAREQIDVVGDSLSELLSVVLEHPPEPSCRIRLWSPQVSTHPVDRDFPRAMEQVSGKQLPVETLIADHRLILLGPFHRGWDPNRAMLAIHDERLANQLLDQWPRDTLPAAGPSRSLVLAPSGPWHRFIESRLRRAKKSIDCISVEPEWAKELHRVWKEGVALRGMQATDSQLAPSIQQSLADISSLTLVESSRVGKGGASVFVLDRERTLIAFPADACQPLGSTVASINQPSLAIELTDPSQVQESIRWIDRELGAAIARRSHRLNHSLR